MSPQNARIAVLPRALASDVMTGAMSRGAWSVAITVILLDIPVAVEIVVRRSGLDHLFVPMAAIAGMLALLAYTGLRPGARARVVYLVAGAGLAGVYQVSILSADPQLVDNGSWVYNRLAFALVLSSPGITRPLVGLAWSIVGYAVAVSTILVSDAIAGVELVVGWGPTVALVISCVAYLVLVGIRSSQGSLLPDLQRLEVETRRAALDHQYEQRAAAMIHDTVLNDLTVVMNSSGPLDDRVRERFRTDVASLVDGAWLRETRGAVELAPADAALRNALVALISEMQWRGLTVDLTGVSEEQVARLSPENVGIATAAVHACLENVLNHAQVSSVEVVLTAGADSVSIMVIDQGVGFDPDSVPADRLGLRSSVVRRVEDAGGTVRIWSKPGKGTSVLIAMPAEGAQ